MERIDTPLIRRLPDGLHRIHGISDDIEAHERGFYAAYDRLRFTAISRRCDLAVPCLKSSGERKLKLKVTLPYVITTPIPTASIMAMALTLQKRRSSHGAYGCEVMDGAHLNQRFG